jgi:flagellar biosynthesis/type III secretory pathway protein FliH
MAKRYARPAASALICRGELTASVLSAVLPACHPDQLPCQTRPVDEYEAEDAAVELARDKPEFDETGFRAAFRVGYNAGHSAGYSQGYKEGLEAGLEAFNSR